VRRLLLALALWLGATSAAFAQSEPSALTIATPASDKALATDKLLGEAVAGKTPYIERVAREPRRVATPAVVRATMRTTPGTPHPAIAPTQTPGGPTPTPQLWGWCRLCACPTNTASIYWSTSSGVLTTTGEELMPGVCVSGIPATDYTCGHIHIVSGTASQCYTLTMEP
jgi:hypothetical protein